MTRPRTTLPPSSAVSIAASVLAGQGQYGVVSQLAREHSVTRQQVYRVGEQARAALEAAFSVPAGGPPLASIELNEADIERAIVALRVVTPASIRDIEDVLPELFGIHWSYGKIQGVIVDAEARAAGWLADVDLSNIDNVALDEMFSQGRPVLGGIDLDFGYLFALDVSPTRTGAEWAEVLGGLQHDQGLTPSVVVKDAGSGLAAGVSAAWPSAEQRDDLFHAVYDMGKLARRLEGKAFGAIARVEELLDKRSKARTEKRRRSLGQLIRRRTESMDAAIARYDAFEALRREAAGVLKLTDRGSGRLRTSAEVRDALIRIAGEMTELGSDRICKLAT
ncbi:MAG: hypothetical protein GY711_33150, partial [bacterium]|nr:hypothetical protein [bacterium]